MTQSSSIVRRIAFIALAMLSGSVRAQAQTINLTWDQHSDSTVVGYTLHVGVNPGVYGVTIDVPGITTTTYSFNQAIPGTRYYFAVSAYTATNVHSNYSNLVSAKINVGPTLTPPAAQIGRIGVASSLQLAATDDGDPLMYSATGLPTGLSISPTTGRISGTPASVGSWTVVATVSDGALSAAQTFTWSVAGPPTADAVAPSTGSGASQVFQLTYSDPLGGAAIGTAWAWFNATFASTSASTCMVYYDRGASRLYVINDAGNGWAPGTLGSNATLQNSQCAVALASSSATVSGNTLTLNLAMTFAGRFSGGKNVYMYAASGGASSGWQTLGTWTVPAPAVAAVTADSASPNTGSGSTQTFALQYSDSLGATDLSTAWVWFNATFASTSANSCMIYVVRSSGALYLINDAGTAWLPGSLGSGTLQNSQCTVNAGGSSLAISGNALTLSLAVTFRPSFSGTKNVYMYGTSAGGTGSGWQTRGTWTVPSATVGVTADAVSPNTGNGATQTFALQYSDSLGATDLRTAWAWFNATFASSGANSCLLNYNRTTGKLNLINDTGTGWFSAALGSGTLQNSACSISLSGSTAVLNGNTMTLNLPITFKAAFSGTKNIYMYADSVSGMSSGWNTRGTWTVPAVASGVTADSVTPNAGAGMAQTFALRYSDSAGAARLRTVWAWFNSSFASTSANSCLVTYNPALNELSLINSTGTAWTKRIFTSTAGTISNGSCTININGSSVSSSGNTLTLNLAVTFGSSFLGAKNIYMFADNTSGSSSGWQTRGAWTVQ